MIKCIVSWLVKWGDATAFPHFPYQRQGWSRKFYPW